MVFLQGRAGLYGEVESSADGLDACAFERENFGVIAQELTAIRNDFLGDGIKVSDLSLTDSAEGVFQSIDKPSSLFSGKSVLAAKNFEDIVICGHGTSQ